MTKITARGHHPPVLEGSRLRSWRIGKMKKFEKEVDGSSSLCTTESSMEQEQQIPITPEEARASLAEIDQVTLRIRQTIAAGITASPAHFVGVHLDGLFCHRAVLSGLEPRLCRFHARRRRDGGLHAVRAVPVTDQDQRGLSAHGPHGVGLADPVRLCGALGPVPRALGDPPPCL